MENNMKKLPVILLFLCAAALLSGCVTTSSTDKSGKQGAGASGQASSSGTGEGDASAESGYTGDPTAWERGDFTLEIRPELKGTRLDLHVTCTNKTSRVLWIPKFYTDFVTNVNGRKTMKGNWLTIINQKDSQSLYRGAFLDPPLDTMWQKANCTELRAGKSYSFTVSNVQDYYYISEDSKMLTIQYQGPLGDSNKVSVTY